MNAKTVRNATVVLFATFAAVSVSAAAPYAPAPHAVHGAPVFVHPAYSRGPSYSPAYGRSQYIPQRGYYASGWRGGYAPIWYRGNPYYYRGGSWYRWYGGRYILFAPPIGFGIPYLPAFYTTWWFGGIPYYYADDAYYVWRPQLNEYVVTDPPAGTSDSGTVPPTSGEIFVYPKNGQSDTQMMTDRDQCHTWATTQSGFDPTQTQSAVSTAQATKRADYDRAQAACLEARGYSVK